MPQSEDLASAVEALHQAFEKLRHLSGETTDAVLHMPSSTTYLFPKVQAELRRMEQVERRHAAERGAILDALPAHMAIIDETGTIIAVNEAWRAFARAHNYPDTSAALGLNYLEVCRAATGNDMKIAQAVGQGLENILAGQSDHFAFDYPCQTPKALLWFNVMIAPLRHSDRTGAVILHVDVTDKLRVEEKLRAAQKLEAVGQLTGGIAHDFNNLLTVILGTSELLAEALEHDPNLARMAEQIMMMAERGAKLTKNLLAFGRRQPLNPQRTDVNGRLVALEELLSRTLGADIEIELSLSEDLFSALVDPGEFDNAILNLSINSRDAMPDGGLLTITTANTDFDVHSPNLGPDMLPGAYVCVTVSDTGVGMTQEVLARGIEPFFTTKDVGKGSGLGLSMVYGFVKQTNGHIMIFSEPNEGTRVRIYFPRYSGEQVAPGHQTGQGQVLPGQETILIVEDNNAISQQLAAQFESLGYQVIATSEGESALAILRMRGDIDLLFCDIILPGGMNGRRVADAAKLIRPGIKILYTSGYSENAIVHQGRLDQGIALLSKPYRRAELAAATRNALDS